MCGIGRRRSANAADVDREGEYKPEGEEEMRTHARSCKLADALTLHDREKK